MQMWKKRVQHGDAHSTTISTNNHKQRRTWHLGQHAWQCLKRHAACLVRAPILRTYTGGTKRLLVIIPKAVISLLTVSRGIIPFERTYCGSRDNQQQYVIKEKNSIWGFTVIKQVGDLAWPQIHLRSLYSHGPGYRAPFQLTVCANSVGVCVHQMNKYLSHAYILKTH